MQKHIPNLLTCLNLFSGCIGVVLAFQWDFHSTSLQNACLFIYLGALFDFFDGFAARMLKVSSPIGTELDSLADMVTFGLLPSVIFFRIFQSYATPQLHDYLPYVSFLIAIFSALRLAKFNVDTRQTTSFIGVPTPANALFISSMPILYASGQLPQWVNHPFFLVALCIVLSLLLVSEIELMALKFKTWDLKENSFKYALVLISALLLVLLGIKSIPLLFCAYLVFSFLEKRLKK